jgi:hypothetical protein
MTADAEARDPKIHEAASAVFGFFETVHESAQTLDRLLKAGCGCRVGQADVCICSAFAEVSPWCEGDIDVVQRAFAELPGSQTGLTHVEVDVAGVWHQGSSPTERFSWRTRASSHVPATIVALRGPDARGLPWP